MSRLHLTRAERRQVEAIREVFRPWGLAFELVTEGKHKCLKVQGPRGGAWRLVIACTPRNESHAIEHARQNAQRLVREINGRAGY